MVGEPELRCVCVLLAIKDAVRTVVVAVAAVDRFPKVVGPIR
jgi:hypothetical protein